MDGGFSALTLFLVLLFENICFGLFVLGFLVSLFLLHTMQGVPLFFCLVRFLLSIQRADIIIFSCYASILRIKLTISMALTAQSKPLFPALVPARSIACSIFSVVSTPNMTGISLFKDMWAMPLETSLHT